MALAMTGCMQDKNDYPPETRKAFERIDSIMSVHDRIIADKEQRLSQLRMLRKDFDDRELVGLYTRLFDSYFHTTSTPPRTMHVSNMTRPSK